MRVLNPSQAIRWTHSTPTPQIFQVYSSLFSWINVCASKWLQQNDFCVSSERRNLLNWLLNDEIYRRFLLLKPFVCIMLVKCWERRYVHIEACLIQYIKNILIKFNWYFRHFLLKRHSDLLHNCLPAKLFSLREKPFTLTDGVERAPTPTQPQAAVLNRKNIKSLNRYIIIITICFVLSHWVFLFAT